MSKESHFLKSSRVEPCWTILDEATLPSHTKILKISQPETRQSCEWCELLGLGSSHGWSVALVVSLDNDKKLEN